MTCENCEHLKNEVWPILYENDSWRAILYGGSQEYLGKSILTCKQHVPTLGKLSEAQWNDLREAIAWYEGRVTEAFAPTHYKWQCLMNNAAGRHEQTHVHWHITPRYEETVEFDGDVFIDSRWPQSSQEVSPKTLSLKKLQQIADVIIDG